MLRGTFPDPATLNYLRDTIGLITYFFDNGGSGLGFVGISPSAAIAFNLYSGHTQGISFAINGNIGDYNSTGDVAFWNGVKVEVN